MAYPALIGAVAFPVEWTNEGDRYEITSEMLAFGTEQAVRKPLTCRGVYGGDSLLIEELTVDGQLVGSVSTD
jgi:hypothetical protein